ncbi:MAG: Smr/MutS family protein [Syntrophaceae bacterium]|nr:Smr/MutS family protein [Syntrophaceae bacterium]
MKLTKSTLTLKSFSDLKALVEKKRVGFPDHPSTDQIHHQEEGHPGWEEDLFNKAMEGVKPIPRKNYVEKIPQIELPKSHRDREDVEILEKLKDLVQYGKGFKVEDTPEYIEGTGYHVHPSVAKRLHRGEYSIQAYVDLHGLVVEDAKDVFERFLKWAVTAGKTGVLIVHGRGLSSPSEPVLKKKVREWLTRGPWRKWVAAYSSARICDGGAGATYVLLRPRPFLKRSKKRKSFEGKF